MVHLYVLAILYIEDSVLLVRRLNKDFGQGLYSLVGGKVETGETALQAIKREVYEETALNISEKNFELVHVFHRKGTESELISLCFKADISNFSEPEKHDDMRFFKLKALPKNIIPAHKQAIECILENITYSEHGW